MACATLERTGEHHPPEKTGAFQGSPFVGADGMGGVDTTCCSKFVLGGKRGETVPELVLKGGWC